MGLLACGGKGTADPCVPETLSLVPGEVTLTALGEGVQLRAAARASDGEICDGASVEWSSSPASICIVDGTGFVTAGANGACTVTAETDGVRGSASITIEQRASRLVFTTQPQPGKAEEELPTLEVCVQDANGSPVEQDNSSAVSLSIGANPGGGALSGPSSRVVAAGCAAFDDLEVDVEGAGYTLVATAAELSDVESDGFDIYRNVDRVVLSCGRVTLVSLTETTQCAARARSPAGRTIPDPDVAGVPLEPTWTTEPVTVCATDTGGLVTAVGNGLCTVGATIDGATGELEVTVRQVPASLTVGPPDLAILAPGEAHSFSVDVEDALGEPIASPPIRSSCLDEDVSTASDVEVGAVSEGVTDCAFTSGSVEDVARVAVVALDGFAAIVANDPASYRVTAAPGSTIEVDLWMVRPNGGSGDLGSLQGELSWDPGSLEFVSSAGIEGGWTWLPNETATASGRLAFAAFSPDGTAATFVLGRLTFDVLGTTGSTSIIDVAVSVAGDSLGDDVTEAVRPVQSRTEIN